MWSGEYCRLSQMIMMMVFRVVLKNAILSSNPWSLEMDCVCASSLSIHKSAWKKKKKEKKKDCEKKSWARLMVQSPLHIPSFYSWIRVRRLEIISGDDILVQIVALDSLNLREMDKSFKFEILPLFLLVNNSVKSFYTCTRTFSFLVISIYS